MRFQGDGAVSLPQMPGQKDRDFIEPFGQGEFRHAMSRAGDDPQRAFNTGIPERPVQPLALNQRHDVVPIAVNGEKWGASAVHMMERAGDTGLFQVL